MISRTCSLILTRRSFPTSFLFLKLRIREKLGCTQCHLCYACCQWEPCVCAGFFVLQIVTFCFNAPIFFNLFPFFSSIWLNKNDLFDHVHITWQLCRWLNDFYWSATFLKLKRRLPVTLRVEFWGASKIRLPAVWKRVWKPTEIKYLSTSIINTLFLDLISVDGAANILPEDNVCITHKF